MRQAYWGHYCPLERKTRSLSKRGEEKPTLILLYNAGSRIVAASV